MEAGVAGSGDVSGWAADGAVGSVDASVGTGVSGSGVAWGWTVGAGVGSVNASVGARVSGSGVGAGWDDGAAVEEGRCSSDGDPSAVARLGKGGEWGDMSDKMPMAC